MSQTLESSLEQALDQIKKCSDALNGSGDFQGAIDGYTESLRGIMKQTDNISNPILSKPVPWEILQQVDLGLNPDTHTAKQMKNILRENDAVRGTLFSTYVVHEKLESLLKQWDEVRVTEGAMGYRPLEDLPKMPVMSATSVGMDVEASARIAEDKRKELQQLEEQLATTRQQAASTTITSSSTEAVSVSVAPPSKKRKKSSVLIKKESVKKEVVAPLAPVDAAVNTSVDNVATIVAQTPSQTPAQTPAQLAKMLADLQEKLRLTREASTK